MSARGGMALNPTSVPFFPSTFNAESVERSGAGSGLGFRLPLGMHELQRTESSNLSLSTSSFRSASSSPASSAPVPDGRNGLANSLSGSGSPGSVGPGQQAVEELPDVTKALMKNVLDNEEAPSPRAIHHWMNSQAPQKIGRETIDMSSSHGANISEPRGTPPILPVSVRATALAAVPSFNMPLKPSSPVSSIGSASFHTSSIDYTSASFEAQLKSSPFIRELMERLTRCELSNREIQGELADIHNKINLLVERALSSSSTEPEFRNPFAPNASLSRSLTPAGQLSPFQHAPTVSQIPKTEDINQLSQRINTLTSSVGQLLALQTQQHINNVSLPQHIPVSGLPATSLDIAPNQAFPSGLNQAALLGQGLPNRLDPRASPRAPNPPTRTWSAGTLEFPIRPMESNMGRPDNLLRDKRRSVAGLTRRDSSGFPESPGENWAGGSSPREQGPLATKWEQLPLAPELLRSLNKFGVGPPNKIQQRALPFLLRGSDIIAQAPPTQERIAAYVIPAIHVAVTQISQKPVNRGPIVLMISTTVDQATQAQRMIRDLGSSIGIKSALGVGAVSPNTDISQELRLLQQNMPHIVCGTPQKLHAIFTSPGGLSGSEVKFLVLDEVDQLIARNLHEFVFNIVKLLPPPRSRGAGATTSGPSPVQQTQTQFNPSDGTGNVSPFTQTGRRFSAISISSSSSSSDPSAVNAQQPNERQTALFSNTVPQDVLNLANTIQLREAVRVLVRRDGNASHTETNQGTKGLRQYYLYLAFTASGARTDSASMNSGGGHGIIGSGRGAISNAEATQAREWKLDALADILDDLDVSQIIVHVGGMTALDAVVFKLASRGLEAVPLHSDMNAGTKLAALNKFRGSTGSIMRQPVTKVLVVYDVQVKAPDVFQVPLVINYDLPQAVEEYAHRVAPAIANNYSKAGVVVNFVTATGGDVEMLRSIECFYKIKCPEVPLSLRDVL